MITKNQIESQCPSRHELQAWLQEDEVHEHIDDHVESCSECQAALDELSHSFEPTLAAAGVGLNADPPFIPNYDTIEQIGQGGMGVVWRASDLPMARDVAIKVLRFEDLADERAVDRFVSEAKLIGQLAHPYIVPVHEMGLLQDGRPYYAMKLVEGSTLDVACRQKCDGPWPGPRMEAVDWFGMVCQAVAFAHRNGIVHRDLKPQNIMVGDHGELYVMDWGLAKVIGADEDVKPEGYCLSMDRPATRAAGTPNYMSPEQASANGAKVDRRSDVFGLGALLCEILTGKPPYDGIDAYAQAKAADLSPAHQMIRNAGHEPELAALAIDCLQKDPDARPQNAGEVAARVQAFLAKMEDRLQQQRVEREKQAVMMQEERRRRRVWRMLTIALAALLICVLPSLRQSLREWSVVRWKQWCGDNGVTLSWHKLPEGVYSISLDAENGDDVRRALSEGRSRGLFPFVRELNISDCSLKAIPDQVFELTKLQVLHAARNADLKSMPSSLENLQELRELNLAATSIESLPKETGALVKLRKLHMPRNKLGPNGLPSALAGLTELRSIHFSKNFSLDKLPEYFGDYVELEELYVEHCGLRELPKTIDNMQKLKVLRISGNPELRIPISAAQLSSLREISVDADIVRRNQEVIAMMEQSGVRVVQGGGGGGGWGRGGGGGGGRGRSRAGLDFGLNETEPNRGARVDRPWGDAFESGL